MKTLSKAAEAATPERKRKAHSEQASVETPSERISRQLRAAEKKRLERIRATVCVYSLKTADSNFGLPFVAVNDHFALLAAKELLPLADVYKVASFCLLDGKISTFPRPVLCLDNKVN